MTISVILINYNSTSFTKDCILSIIEKTNNSIEYEIIVVDNASKIEEFRELKTFLDKDWPIPIKLHRSLKNIGFGSGNNLGAEMANGQILAFVNNDTILKNDCLSITSEFLRENIDVAVCSPQQFNESGEVQKSFDYPLTLSRELMGRKFLRLLNPDKFPERQKLYTKPLKVAAVPGSFMAVEAESFKKVNGFDPEIFLYYEESDLCHRLSLLTGRNKCFLVPEAAYYHFKGKSTSKNLAIKKELKISLMHVIKKNSGQFKYLLLKNWLSLKYLVKSIFKPKNFEMFKFMMKGAPMSESLKHQQKRMSE